MSSDLHGYTRRKIAAILEKYRVEDDAMEADLIEACWSVRAWQPTGPAEPIDPRVVMVERISGQRVDAVARESVAEMVGDSTEAALKKAWQDWRVKGRDPKSFIWVKWARTAFRAPQTAQQEPAGFQGLKDWAAQHGTD